MESAGSSSQSTTLDDTSVRNAVPPYGGALCELLIWQHHARSGTPTSCTLASPVSAGRGLLSCRAQRCPGTSLAKICDWFLECRQTCSVGVDARSIRARRRQPCTLEAQYRVDRAASDSAQNEIPHGADMSEAFFPERCHCFECETCSSYGAAD